MSKLLETQGLSKYFGGVKAVDNVNISVYADKIQGIIGPNGAGKSTLFNLISGLYEPTEGKVCLLGEDLSGLKPHLIQRKGIARTFQNIRLFKEMSVIENVLVGGHINESYSYKDAIFKTKKYRIEEKKSIELAEELLKDVDLYNYRYDKPTSLPYGLQRRLEIARALASKPKVLMLDEPAAGMNEQETGELTEFIRGLKNKDLAILIIEHDMSLVMNLCDHVNVMNYGQRIASGPPEEIVKSKVVIDAYLGEDVFYDARS